MTKKEKIQKFLSGLDTDVDFGCIADSEINSWDELVTAVEDNNLLNVEIIYYANAMEYLMENDSSLQESMKIASDLGYDCKNINSELLASLLATENLREEFFELQSEVEEFFEKVN